MFSFVFATDLKVLSALVTTFILINTFKRFVIIIFSLHRIIWKQQAVNMCVIEYFGNRILKLRGQTINAKKQQQQQQHTRTSDKPTRSVKHEEIHADHNINSNHMSIDVLKVHAFEQVKWTTTTTTQHSTVSDTSDRNNASVAKHNVHNYDQIFSPTSRA